MADKVIMKSNIPLMLTVQIQIIFISIDVFKHFNYYFLLYVWICCNITEHGMTLCLVNLPLNEYLADVSTSNGRAKPEEPHHRMRYS